MSFLFKIFYVAFTESKTIFSVCCHVHKFFSYFYVTCPSQLREEHIPKLKESLNQAIKKNLTMRIKEPVTTIELTQKLITVQGKQTLANLLKITCAIPSLTGLSVETIKIRELLPGIDFKNVEAYESNIDFEVRFLIDLNIGGCCIWELPANTWTLRTDETPLVPQTNCQIEVDVNYKKLVTHATLNLKAIAPFRILSFDIETGLLVGTMSPDPNVSQVYQIANVVMLHGQENPFLHVIFTLKNCTPIENAQIYSFEDEKQLLRAWSRFIKEVDPDFVAGYAILNFDLEFLIRRASRLEISDFGYLGRIKEVK